MTQMASFFRSFFRNDEQNQPIVIGEHENYHASHLHAISRHRFIKQAFITAYPRANEVITSYDGEDFVPEHTLCVQFFDNQLLEIHYQDLLHARSDLKKLYPIFAPNMVGLFGV